MQHCAWMFRRPHGLVLQSQTHVTAAPPSLQALFDAAVERLSGPATTELLSRKPGAAPTIDAGKQICFALGCLAAALRVRQGCTH